MLTSGHHLPNTEFRECGSTGKGRSLKCLVLAGVTVNRTFLTEFMRMGKMITKAICRSSESSTWCLGFGAWRRLAAGQGQLGLWI